MNKIPATSLVLVAFNRPDLLQQQLAIVRSCHRGPIYAIVDGSREGRLGESERVRKVIQLLEGLRDQFEVEINCSDSNLGCYRRIKSGLDWVFSKTDRAIILEDDCMPSPQFFEFAEEMLERYASNERIYSISGTNLFPNFSPEEQRFFFSRYNNCWGWATWSRAWNDFLDSPETWRTIRKTRIFRGMFRDLRSFLYWRRIFDLTYSGKINSWAYRWKLSSWMQNGLTLYPAVNLITNVGDGDEATHTATSPQTHQKIGVFKDELYDPIYVIPDCMFDQKIEDMVYSKTFVNRLLWLIKKLK